MIDTIGYKTIPVTIHTMKGPITGSVGITYSREGNKVWVLEYWMNPSLVEKLDRVEQDLCKLEASRIFSGAYLPTVKERTWEGVVYG
jgi:hypothetical protein